MGTAAKRPQESGTLDGVPEVPTEPVDGMLRADNFYLKEDRIQSGSLSDDPTDSGAPVKNRRSYKATKGNSR